MDLGSGPGQSTHLCRDTAGCFNRFFSLEDAFATRESDPGPRAWRTQIHFPVFLNDLDAFCTTRFAIRDALSHPKVNPPSRQLQIETHAWDAMPDCLKSGDIVDYVCRQIEWVRGQLD